MKRARHRWRRILPAAVAGLAVALIAAGCALTCRPAWYQPASIDYARLEADKRELVQLLDEIGSALNGGRAIDLELHEDQVNRWIAARTEIWPDSETAALEPLRYPQLTFLGQNRVRMAALVEWGRLQPLVSSVCRIELDEHRLVVTCADVDVGRFPAPRGRLLALVRALLPESRAVQEQLSHTRVSFVNDWIWPNGKKRFRIRILEITDQAARVRLEPLRADR